MSDESEDDEVEQRRKGLIRLAQFVAAWLYLFSFVLVISYPGIAGFVTRDVIEIVYAPLLFVSRWIGLI